MNLFSKKQEEITPTAPIQKTVSVLMQDGTIEEYPESFHITDGKNCVVCQGDNYHTNFDCKFLKMEMLDDAPLKAMKRYDAEAQCKSYCFYCKELDELDD